jgi:O-antigen/teichoic acid export membrane protein
LSWALYGSFFYVLSQWLLLIILAKLGGPTIVGRYTLALAITAPIVLFSNLQLRAVLASDVQRTFPFSTYVALRIVTSLGALLPICGIAFWVGFTGDQTIVICLIGLAKVIESGSDIAYGAMQKNERMDLVSISKGIRGALAVGSVAAIFYQTKSLIAAVVGLNVAWLVVLVLVDCRNLKGLADVSPKRAARTDFISEVTTGRMVSLCKLSLPLGVVSMLMSCNTALPRYLLAIFHGEAAVGYFSAIVCFTIACTIGPEAFGQAALPRLAKYLVESITKFWHLMGMLILAAVLIGVVGIMTAILEGTDILRVVYQQEFSRYSDLLVMVMVLGMAESICSVLGVGLTAMRRVNSQVSVLIGVVAVTALSGWWLIPQYAMKGAVLSALLGMTVWGVVYGVLLRTPRDIAVHGVGY